MKIFKMYLFVFFFIYGFTGFADLAKDSIYQAENSWIDNSGQTIKLSTFKGQPVFISMVYLSCPHSCPLTIAKFKEIEKKLIDKKIKDYRFVLASFDFEKDTPEKLAKYMEEKNLSKKHWTLITAKNDETVRSLSIVLGISYKKLDDGDFSHSNVINLLDEDGRILSSIDRLSSDDSVMIKALEKRIETK